MTIVSHPLRALSLYEEPDGSFGVDHSGTAGDFLAVPAQAGMSWTAGRDLLDPNILQQYKHGRTTKVHGKKSTTLSLTVPLGLTGTLANGSTASLGKADTALFRLLAIAMGGVRSGNMGSTVASATDGDTFVVASGHGSRFTAGGACGRINAAGNMEICPIASVSTDTIQLKHAFSATPSVSDVIYNATTFYLDDSATHAQWLAEGAEPDDYWSIRGTQLSSMSFGLGMGELPTISFEFQGATWAYLGSGSLSGKTYSNYTPQAFNAGYFLAQAEGTATRAETAIHNFALNSALTYAPVMSPQGTETILKYIQSHTPGVATGSFGTYYEAQTWFDAWTNKTLYNLCLQIGRSSAGGILLECAGAQLGPVTAPEDANGVSGSTVPFECGLDNGATGLTTAIRRSGLRLHFVG